MRKVIFAAIIVAALTVFAGGSSVAWADCGCKEKCGCSQKADCGCKDKCGCEKKSSCACKKESKCGCKAESKCGCKSESKCGCSKPKCGCKSKCGCEKPKCGCSNGCDCCVQKVPQNHHPYECQFRGSSMLCDKGCCGGPVCIPKCEVCTTTCTKKECTDGCGCTHVSWESHTTCGLPERPRTIPWWFNIEAGSGNIYPTGDEKMESNSEEDSSEEMASAETAEEEKETVESSEA